MAKTLLNAVNQILKRTGIIAGDSGTLTSLTDSPRQSHVDVAVQVVNEGLVKLYSTAHIALPKEQAEDSVFLVTNIQSYPLPDDLVQIHWPLIDRTNNQRIWEMPGGYNAILESDPEQDDTGVPHWAAISPVDGELFLDRKPTSAENGNEYKLQYHKDISLTLAADKMPFNDSVFLAMVPAWVQLWKREKRNEFDGDLFKRALGDAARLLSGLEARRSWFPK